MKPGDLVRRKRGRGFYNNNPGLFIGIHTFKNSNLGDDYTCALVMWFDRLAPNGDVISTIQSNLIEVLDENR